MKLFFIIGRLKSRLKFSQNKLKKKGDTAIPITYPHIEEFNLTHYISPKGEYQLFQNEDHCAEEMREWELSSAKEVKKPISGFVK
ncbi:hypothetical protein AWH48_17100 [Domibacillus aminovorans]|uniref:Uncharacterized protein n=1 Tax=Domibacillus aminovorans TaxID=29332 RepID=A0A177KZW8_9BACI|nr:hypothetical protein [Domibacillus aminovorans]OAH58706.1 hypothetical protein AWH48_17100 [Domibacillus aminovorans]